MCARGNGPRRRSDDAARKARRIAAKRSHTVRGVIVPRLNTGMPRASAVRLGPDAVAAGTLGPWLATMAMTLRYAQIYGSSPMRDEAGAENTTRAKHGRDGYISQRICTR